MLNTAAPTTPELKARINAVFNSVGESLQSLAARWLDENEYENIEDYRAVLQKALPEDFKIIAMTKRPFGFKFTAGTEAVYHMTASMRSISWKRLS